MYLLREISLTIVVILFIIHKGSGQKAINCYICESTTTADGKTEGAECNDPFDKSKFNTTKCPGVNPRCGKATISQGGNHGTGRMCFPTEGYCDALEAMMKISGVTVDSCQECSNDGCNSGRQSALPAHQLVLLLLGLAASAPFFLSFR